MIKVLFWIAIVVLVLIAILLAIYICRTKPGSQEVARIGVYIAVITILITVIIPLVVENGSGHKSKKSNNEIVEKDVNLEKNDESEDISEKPIVEENNEKPVDSSTNETNKSDTPIKDETNNESGSEDNTNNVLSEPTDSITSEQEDEQRKTVFLYETKTYSFNGNVTREDVLSDPRGNNYNDAYLFGGEYYTLNTGGGKYDKPFIEKYIGGEYDSFTAIIIPYKTFDKYGKNVQAKINIYADNELVYTSNTISRKTEQEQISLSVSGVKYLKIELVPATELQSYYNQYSVILYNATLASN